MNRALFMFLAVIACCATGCLRQQCNCGGGGCGPGALRPRGYALHRDNGGLLGHHKQAVDPEEGLNGPASAAVAYPYYTVRGPRDFLMDNPPSIGR